MNSESFDRVSDRLNNQDCADYVSDALREDVACLVRNWDRVRNLKAEFGSIEVSPHMRALMDATGVDVRGRKMESARLAMSV